MSRQPLNRRALLKRASLLGAAALAAPATGCVQEEAIAPAPQQFVFLHGVASGDPLPDAVILWTRVTSPDGDAVPVAYQVARDEGMTDVVAEGTAEAVADTDHTVKRDVTGLAPDTTYYYQFSALDERSPVGRTRTAPSGTVSGLRFAVCSCASYGHGYFNAYRAMAKLDDLQAVLHLGDYIYEYETGRYGDTRDVEPPHEVVTLDDYRRRYAHYRTDPDLQVLHQRHPVIAIWDDHESANNAWSDGAQNHGGPEEGDWETRKAAVVQAYNEWMPIREQPDGKIWRAFRYGELVDLMMLDARLWGRDQQGAGGDDPILLDPERTLLGDDQEAWLFERLQSSSAQWKLIGQQVMIGQLPQFLNTDQWDGYPAARQRLFDLIRDERVDNVVVLTGDIHTSWAMDLTDDPFSAAYDPATGAGAVGVELVTPGISSPGFGPELVFLSEGLLADNPHLFYADVVHRGFILVDVDAQRVEATWHHFIDVETVNDDETIGGVVVVQGGTPHIVVQS